MTPASTRVHWQAVIVVALSLSLGCGGAATVRRGPTYIASIEVEGNRALRADALVPHLALDRTRRGGRGVDPYQLSLDVSRIRTQYLRHGFFEAQVEARVEGETGPQRVVFRVTEGRRARLRVVINGLPPEIPAAEARRLVALAEEAPFVYEIYELAKEPLLALVQAAGYAHAELDASVTIDKDTAIATASYAIAPGPRSTFGAVTIEGASEGLREAIEGRLELAAGTTYSPAALAGSRRAIHQLGRFSLVRVEPQLVAGDDVVPVKVTVTRGSRGELKVGGGGGYDGSAWELRLRGAASHIPDALPLWTFGVEARVAARYLGSEEGFEPKLRALVSGQRTELFRPRVVGDVGVGVDYFTVEAYTATGPFMQLGLSVPLAKWLQFRAGWSLTLLSFDDISPVLDEAARMTYGLQDGRRLGTFQQTLTADLRDDPLDARRGVFLSLRVVEGTRYAGGEYDYVQLTPDVRGYLPLGRVVLAMRARATTFLGDEVPVTERILGGGVQSQRGFAYRQLAPSVRGELDGQPASVLIGGVASFETSVEARTSIGTVGAFPLIAAVFLDGADVVDPRTQLFARQLHWAAGIGAGVNLNGFKVQGEIGYRLNRTGPDEPSYRPDAWFPRTALSVAIGDVF